MSVVVVPKWPDHVIYSVEVVKEVAFVERWLGSEAGRLTAQLWLLP
jgi:hypothetical protein